MKTSMIFSSNKMHLNIYLLLKKLFKVTSSQHQEVIIMIGNYRYLNIFKLSDSTVSCVITSWFPYTSMFWCLGFYEVIINKPAVHHRLVFSWISWFGHYKSLCLYQLPVIFSLYLSTLLYLVRNYLGWI